MTVAIQNLENLGSVRAKLNEVIAATEVTAAAEAKRFTTVAALLADSTLTYTTAPAGSIIEAGGFRYSVAAVAATDQHVATAGGVKLYVQPSAGGKVTPQQFGAVGDGATDDRPAFVALNTYGGDAYLPKPPVAYNVATAINLDKPAITVDPTASWEALTDTGNITWNTNLFTQQDPPVPVHRFNGRAFFGDAAHEMAGGWVAGSSNTADRGTEAWYAKSNPVFGGYTGRDATAVIANGHGTIALALSARSSQQWNSAWQAPIGLAVFMYNDGNAAADDSSAWGIIVEGRQNRAGRRTFGMEVALGNISDGSPRPTPYNIYAGPTNGGVIGAWFAGGGDGSVSSPATNPNAAAICVLKGASNTGISAGWETGIVFSPDAVVGTDGAADSTTLGDAILLSRNQTVAWYEPDDGSKAFSVTSAYTTAADATRLEAYATGGVMGLRFIAISGARTQVDLRGVSGNTTTTAVVQAETNAIRLSGEGSATNIDVLLVPKGTGNVRFGTRTASSDVPVTGYIEIKDAGGTVRRLALVD